MAKGLNCLSAFPLITTGHFEKIKKADRITESQLPFGFSADYDNKEKIMTMEEIEKGSQLPFGFSADYDLG